MPIGVRKKHPWSRGSFVATRQASAVCPFGKPAAGMDSAVLNDGIVSALAVVSLESVCPSGLV